MAELKHVARVKSTGKKCLVAFRTLPGEANSCLIIPTENLPDAYHDALINLVDSNTGQTAHEFAEVLARRSFPDGSNMLAALHTQSRMVKVSTDMIEMTPTPNAVILLSELNQIIAEQRGCTVDDLSIKSGYTPEPVAETTPVVETRSDEDVAASYRAEAARLLKLAEDLFPVTKSAPEVAVVKSAPEVVAKTAIATNKATAKRAEKPAKIAEYS